MRASSKESGHLQNRLIPGSSSYADSAAGATAFSCALKTYNGAIGTTPAQTPCGTILEAAKRQGFATGLVATSRITHATPASFYAHVPDRDLETEIAEFLVDEDGSSLKGLPVDFAFGGGRCFFLPNGTDGSCRTDSKDLIARAKEKGIKVVQGMAELREYREEGGDDATVLGLFSDDVSWAYARSYSHHRACTDFRTHPAYGLRDRQTKKYHPAERTAEPEGDVRSHAQQVLLAQC